MFSLIFLGGEQLGMRAGGAQSSLPSGWWLLGAGLLVGLWYVRRQWRLPAPLLPVDLLRIPVFALSMCGSVSAFCAQMLAYLALPFLLLESHGMSPIEAGLLITAWPLATVMTAPIAGRLIGRYADGLLGGIGMAMFACGLWALAAMPDAPSTLDMVWRMLLAGSGFALYQSPNNHTIVTSAPLARSGAAGGMLSSARLTGRRWGPWCWPPSSPSRAGMAAMPKSWPWPWRAALRPWRACSACCACARRPPQGTEQTGKWH